jgi:hypothetical protein
VCWTHALLYCFFRLLRGDFFDPSALKYVHLPTLPQWQGRFTWNLVE